MENRLSIIRTNYAYLVASKILASSGLLSKLRMLKYQMEFGSGTAHTNNVGFTITGIGSVTYVCNTGSILPLFMHVLLFRLNECRTITIEDALCQQQVKKQTCLSSVLLVKMGLSMDERMRILPDSSVD